VNVRDTSVSSNEGTSNFNNMLKPLNDEGSKDSINIDKEIQAINKQEHKERVKAGFNVSYDSNSF
jgi:hypothetical protein